ncbi:MAG: hypothetical protein AAGL24_08870 [Pseudomonadota bacterium]
MTVRHQLHLDDLQGVWHRVWLSAPGHHDSTTRVSWVQAGTRHVDLRLPERVPDIAGARALKDLDAATLRLLAAFEGFAGTTVLDDDVCTWQREINYQGAPQGPDVGKLEHTPDGLLETGLLANYSELWRLGDAGPALAHRFVLDDQIVVLASSGKTFGLGRARPDAMREPTSFPRQVESALEAGDQSALGHLFDQEFCFGELQDGAGMIRHSTNPLRVGDRAFECSDLTRPRPEIVLYRTDFAGKATQITLR